MSIVEQAFVFARIILLRHRSMLHLCLMALACLAQRASFRGYQAWASTCQLHLKAAAVISSYRLAGRSKELSDVFGR